MIKITIILCIYEIKKSVFVIIIFVFFKYKILVVKLVHFNIQIIETNNLLVYCMFLFKFSIAIMSLKNPFIINTLISSTLLKFKSYKILSKTILK